MLPETVSASILNEKAKQKRVTAIATAEPKTQLAIFQETLTYLEKYLDTGDLGKLSPKSLGFIRDDILQIIEHLREVKSSLPRGTVTSADGILEKLRDARDNIYTALKMFDTEETLKETQTKQFFAELRASRKSIEEGLAFFAPVGGSKKAV